MMNIIRTMLVASMLLVPGGLGAQIAEGQRMQEPPKMRTPEEIAKEEADSMKAELNLTDKQYKKVYNLIKSDHEYRQSQMESRMGGGMPPQGGPGGGGPGMGGFDGGPGMGGGPGGPGMGGGMPPQGDMGGGMPPQGAPGAGGPGMGPGQDIVTDEYLEKQDKKLQKILTEEQYAKWRSKHPSERMELPPMEIIEQ